MTSPDDGILLVDKDPGESSFDVIRKLKRSLKVKKVGHAGTLDPFATGLLILLLGQGTKLSSYLMGGRKRYLAVLRLGIETDTQDPTGRIVRRRPVPPLDAETVMSRAQRLVGEVVQVPPQYSAVKVRGRRAYKLARQGIRMDLAPRRVRIYELSVLSLALPDVTLDITCSGGTYIRSLASDLGVRLETGAHLRSLRRLESGSFTVDAALPSGDLGRVPPREVLAQRLIPLGKCLPGLDSLRVDDVMAERLRRGDRPGWNELEDVQQEQLPSGGTLQVLNRGELVALLDPPGRRVEAGARVSIARVFH